MKKKICVDTAFKMRAEGYKFEAIGAYFGISRQAVWDALRRRKK